MSGAAGLIYQIVWFKFIGLFMGNTTYAQITVLATFLLGLAFGNYWFGKKSDVFKNPLFIYALLELFIGIYCIFYPALSSIIGNLFLLSAKGLDADTQSFSFSAIRFFVSSLLLLLPTIAMGGTLPVLSKFFIDDVKNSRREFAVLYFLNSFGAVIGILFAGFVLIKEFGLNITIYSAAAINILLGLCALLVSRETRTVETKEISAQEDSPTKITISRTLAVVLVVTAGLSGFAALLYEMVWTRLLINFFGSSTYAFSIMLLSFISGITLGSLIVSQDFFKKYNYVFSVVVFQIGIASSTAFVLFFYERLPYYLWKISALFSKTPESFPFFLGTEFLICFLLILIPTIFMGMTLPVIVDVISSATNKIGFSVGRVYSINTVGTVAGVILTGLFLVPTLGIKGSFETGIAVNLFAAVLLLWFCPEISSRLKTGIYTALPLSFAVYLFLFPSWNVEIMLSGVFRDFKNPPPATFDKFVREANNVNVLFYKEGVNANVAVTQSKNNPPSKGLIINGKPDASSSYDMPTQILLGQIPVLLKGNARNVFIVGFGSGTTIGSVLTHPVKSVICAEISKEVIAAGKFFKKENRNCLADKRLRVINEDALTLLKISKENFDVIISEPSNPWIAGIGNLFSREYFETCRNKLTSSGIMVQWFHLYETDDDVVKLVLNTFSSVFKHCQLWKSIGNDIILVGSKNKIVLDHLSLKKNFSIPLVKSDLQRIGINNLFTFLCCQIAADRNFYLMSSGSPINTEIHPTLEFLAPESFFIGRPSTYPSDFDEKFDTLSSGLLIKDFIKHNIPTKNDVINAFNYQLNELKNYRFSYGLARYLNNLHPGDETSERTLLTILSAINIESPRKPILNKLIEQSPDSLQYIKDYNNILLNENMNATSFLKIFSIDNQASAFIKNTKPDSVSILSVYIQLAKAYYENSEFPQSKKLIQRSEKMLAADTSLIRNPKVSMDDYFFVHSILSWYDNDPEAVFVNYLALINHNPSYYNLFKLRRLVSWGLKKEASPQL